MQIVAFPLLIKALYRPLISYSISGPRQPVPYQAREGLPTTTHD